MINEIKGVEVTEFLFSSDEIASILQSTVIDGNFENATVQYDEESDTYICNITQSGLTAAAMGVINGTIERSEWDYMVDTVVNFCDTLYTELQILDSGSSVAVFLLNDVNTDNTLMGILNGVVIYDIVDESLN